MKNEIYSRGPIACGIMVTDDFVKYDGGIYQEQSDFPIINHEVSVVGWGQDASGTEYWIVRNSWGTYWGEDGYARVKMYENNLGLETDCSWAVPSLEGNPIY